MLRECGGEVGPTCRRLKISDETVRNEKKRDAEFAKQVEAIANESVEDARAECFRRGMNGSDTLLKLYLAVHDPRYTQRHLLEHQGRIDVDHDVRITVVRDEKWYGNDAHSKAAARLASSNPGAVIEGTIQSSDMRPAVGQDGDRSDGHT